MIDINLIRDNPEIVRKALTARQMDDAPVEQVLELDKSRRDLIQQVETLKAERNLASKEIGRMKDPAERQAKIDAMRSGSDTDHVDEIGRSRARAQPAFEQRFRPVNDDLGRIEIVF